MANYSLIEFETVKGKYKIYKLAKNDVCYFDIFENEMKTNFDKEMNSFYQILDYVARGFNLPGTKVNSIKGYPDNIQKYEIKTHNLRVYCFIESKSNNIIVLGGLKKNQKKDIKRFQSIIVDYLTEKGG